MKRALLSVSNKEGLVPFARELLGLGFELLSTGGTAKTLRQEGLSVTDVSEVTGFPELFEGRVKTLHPALHAGILVRRDRPEDLEALEAQGLKPIDLVAVNLYPFQETAARPDVSWEEVVEQIDIGGPSLLRAAAKNYRHVIAVVDAADYQAVLGELKSSGDLAERSRLRLMRKVFAHTASYDCAIAEYLSTRGEPGKGEEGLPDWWAWPATKRSDLRYGENPHQRAAWYRASGLGGGAWLSAASVLQGKELSYNNLLDLHAAASCVREFPDVAAVVVKHNTPCGVARHPSSAEEAYRAARAADETSAFGGIVALNQPVDEATARALGETFLEAVVAPGFSAEARAVLAQKKNVRLLALPALDRSAALAQGPWWEIRSIGDGVLLQEIDRPATDLAGLTVPTKRKPSDKEMEAMRFAWRVVKHVRSNAIVFASADRTLAIGGGQTSRVEAVELAARKGGTERLRGSAVASDAYFPFRDGLEACAEAGATCVIQPGGSVRDAEVIAAANERNVAMVFTAQRHFRH
jgi:phosphoribosylaminoimidazolecarboxamide formyltransferase/IMP cyclohydrolase